MKKLFFTVMLGLMLATPGFSGELKLGGKTAIIFATAEQGRKILTARDSFVQRMSRFDRSARLKTDRDVPEKEYLQFAAASVLEWSEEEKSLLEPVLLKVLPRLEALSLPWPETIYLIKTTGAEEGGTAYTRGNAIIMPASNIRKGRDQFLSRTFCHELFHILSRQNPDLREKLYAAIGFQKCNELELPSKLRERKITNPDAPGNDHCIKVQTVHGPELVIPVLFAQSDMYDTDRGGVFFDYLEFMLLVVQRNPADGSVKYDDANYQLLRIDQVSGFLEQTGKNSNYIIHPEEILADNFALLVLGAKAVSSPEVINRMERILTESRVAGSAPSISTDKH